MSIWSGCTKRWVSRLHHAFSQTETPATSELAGVFYYAILFPYLPDVFLRISEVK